MRKAAFPGLLIAVAIGSSATTALGQQPSLTVTVTTPATGTVITGNTGIQVAGSIQYPAQSGYSIEVTVVITDSSGKASTPVITSYNLTSMDAGTLNYSTGGDVPAPTVSGQVGTVTVTAKSQRGYTGTGTSNPIIK